MRRHTLIAAVAVALVGSYATVGLTGRAVAAEGTAQPGHGKAEKHKLGRKQIAGYTVSVIVVGEVEAGKTADFDIKLIDAKTDPKALRVWVGTEDGNGSTKAEGKKGATTYAGTVTAPSPLPKGAKLWVEIETADGVKSAAYDYDHHDHKH